MRVATHTTCGEPTTTIILIMTCISLHETCLENMHLYKLPLMCISLNTLEQVRCCLDLLSTQSPQSILTTLCNICADRMGLRRPFHSQACICRLEYFVFIKAARPPESDNASVTTQRSRSKNFCFPGVNVTTCSIIYYSSAKIARKRYRYTISLIV